MARKKEAEQLELPDIKRKEKILPLKCGECVFFARQAVYGKPCMNLGTVTASTVCSHFTPDPVQLSDPSEMEELLLSIAKTKKPRLVAQMLLSASKVARLGFHVGQTVYFRVISADYLSNYASAVVVGSAKGNIVLAGKQKFTAVVAPSSLLTKDQLSKKRERLKKAGKIKDPNGIKHVKRGNLETLQAAGRFRSSTRPDAKKGPIILR